MNRFFTDEKGIVNHTACLEATDAHHALKVMRLGVGDEITLMDGEHLYLAEIADTANNQVTCRIVKPLPSTEAHLRVTLYQGLPKGDKMDLIVQKATELGVDAIVPVAMKRCVVQLKGKDGEKKQERWQKIAREAAKQSGRAQVPVVHAPIALSKIHFDGALVIPWEDEHSASLTTYHRAHPNLTQISVLIGPEGGIAAEEISLLPGEPVTLGPRILRTETAGLCALSALYTLYGDLGDNTPC
ncbi:MAG: 16S rRNA (uracil(1498)-N(3))-methyltransferase [Clostridia bacterium]|nr:16S rRNA (uracil(1498)-N(3))-methyltransferase [Clostridia bacterium]